MLHGPAAAQGKDPASGYKTRLGAWLFLVYALVYVGFVALNLVQPGLMGSVAFLGLNVATAYGFGLIVIALILALFYNRACLREEQRLASSKPKKEKA